MNKTQKRRLEEFLLNAFLFAFFRKVTIPVTNGRRYLTSGNLQVIATEFIGWCHRLDVVLHDSKPVEVRDALQAVYPNPSGQSERLTTWLARGATYHRGIIAPVDMEVPDVSNPMLGPELIGGVTKEDVRALLAKLAEPWHL